MKKALGLWLIFLGLQFSSAFALESPHSLDNLLEQVRQEGVREESPSAEKEAAWLSADQNQKVRLLKEAKARLQAEEKRRQAQKKAFARNETRILAFETEVTKEAGSLLSLFSVVRQESRALADLLETSLVSAQKPGRSKKLRAIAGEKQLPSIEKLEQLWVILLEEMNESAKVVRFRTTVIASDGTSEEKEVIRLGLFNLISEGNYLQYQPETGTLMAFSRQPEARFIEMAKALESAPGRIVPVGIDPSGGAVLARLAQVPGALEQIRQGGMIGYLILALGGIAFLIICERFVYLSLVGQRILRQIEETSPRLNNALGRIMRVYTEDMDQDVETLEHRLDEATLKEIPRLERGLPTVAILAAVAPLLGLLGTVTGMIETFQSITLFGTGDPKLMSGGISHALVTTELGLVVAIPIVLLHSFISGKSKRLVQILDEQSAGIVARLAERHHARPS